MLRYSKRLYLSAILFTLILLFFVHKTETVDEFQNEVSRLSSQENTSLKRSIRSPTDSDIADEADKKESLQIGNNKETSTAITNLKSARMEAQSPTNGEFKPEHEENLQLGSNFWHPIPLFGHVYLMIRDVPNINEKEETLTLDFDMELKWHHWGNKVDTKKLIYIGKDAEGSNSYIVDQENSKDIWIPNINFEDNVQLTKQSLVKEPLNYTYNRGLNEYTYTTRDSVKLKCRMAFQYYPMDIQSCHFTLKSYSYNLKHHIRWNKQNGKKGVYFKRPTELNFNVQVESIKDSTECGVRKWGACTFPNRNADPSFKMLIRRNIGHTLVQTYLPSSLCILINCLCFLLPSEHSGEVRIGISMIIFVALVVMFSSIIAVSKTTGFKLKACPLAENVMHLLVPNYRQKYD